VTCVVAKRPSFVSVIPNQNKEGYAQWNPHVRTEPLVKATNGPTLGPTLQAGAWAGECTREKRQRDTSRKESWHRNSREGTGPLSLDRHGRLLCALRAEPAPRVAAAVTASVMGSSLHKTQAAGKEEGFQSEGLTSSVGTAPPDSRRAPTGRSAVPATCPTRGGPPAPWSQTPAAAGSSSLPSSSSRPPRRR